MQQFHDFEDIKHKPHRHMKIFYKSIVKLAFQISPQSLERSFDEHLFVSVDGSPTQVVFVCLLHIVALKLYMFSKSIEHIET